MENLAANTGLPWRCPQPGCGKGFTELWRLRQHHRTAPTADPTGARGHGTELTHCPRCHQELSLEKNARHRCKRAPGVLASDAEAVAAATAPAKEANGARASKRRRQAEPSWQALEAGGGSSNKVGEEAGPRRSTPPQPGQAVTPRGNAAAHLLMDFAAKPGAEGLQQDSYNTPPKAAAFPGAVAAAAGAPGSSGKARWWQFAVQPALAAIDELPPPMPLPIAAPGGEHFHSSCQSQQQHFMLPKPHAERVAALLGELMTLLQLAVSKEDAQAFLQLVVSWASKQNTAAAVTSATVGAAGGTAGPPSIDALAVGLLAALEADLCMRITAVRQLLAEQRQAELAEGLQGTMQAERLTTAVLQLSALLARVHNDGVSAEAQ